jgi:hypothetical protein
LSIVMNHLHRATGAWRAGMRGVAAASCVLAAAALLLGLAGALPGRTAAAQDPAAEAAVGEWLRRSCGLGGEVDEARLAALGTRVTDPLIAAYVQGPPAAELEMAAAAEAEAHEGRMRRLQGDPPPWLSAADRSAMLAEPREAAAARARAEYAELYRTQALHGLGRAGGTRAEAFLREVTARGEPAMAAAAARALELAPPR